MTEDNQPTRELNKDLSLNSLEQDDLDTESENEEHTTPLSIDKPSEPISFRECVKLTNSNYSYEVYSSCLTADQLAGIILQLHNELKGNKKEKTYIG